MNAEQLASLAHVETVIYWWGWPCFLTGAPANLLLLWLIHTRTSREMCPFARILTQTAVLDLASALALFIYTPVIISTRHASVAYGIGIASADGGASIENRRWNYYRFILFIGVSSMAKHTIPAQFYYRYAVMGQKDVSRWAS